LAFDGDGDGAGLDAERAHVRRAGNDIDFKIHEHSLRLLIGAQSFDGEPDDDREGERK
jgi:hypothetical protein